MKKPTLFAVTQPQIQHDRPTREYKLMTAEESIVYMARVSSPNQRTEDASGLLQYLVKHGHWSPFDMVDMTVEVETSGAIMAQILRHWSFRFQEFSQRYSPVADGIDWSHVEARMKAEGGNRQGSGEVNNEISLDLQDTCKSAESEYQVHLSDKVSPETARMILPRATPTRAYMKGSVRSWMTYFWQRLDAHAQKEHRELAEQLFEIFKGEFPVIADLVTRFKPQVMEVEK